MRRPVTAAMRMEATLAGASRFGLVQRCPKRRQLGRRQHAVAGVLAGALDATRGVRVLRPPLPPFSQAEQSAYERQHGVA